MAQRDDLFGSRRVTLREDGRLSDHVGTGFLHQPSHRLDCASGADDVVHEYGASTSEERLVLLVEVEYGDSHPWRDRDLEQRQLAAQAGDLNRVLVGLSHRFRVFHADSLRTNSCS